MKKLIVAILSFSLISCANFNKIPDAIITEKIVNIDPRALESCAPLIKIAQDSTIEDILTITVSNMEIYYDCKNKQELSIKLLKQFSNKGTNE